MHLIWDTMVVCWMLIIISILVWCEKCWYDEVVGIAIYWTSETPSIALNLWLPFPLCWPFLFLSLLLLFWCRHLDRYPSLILLGWQALSGMLPFFSYFQSQLAFSCNLYLLLQCKNFQHISEERCNNSGVRCRCYNIKPQFKFWDQFENPPLSNKYKCLRGKKRAGKYFIFILFWTTNTCMHRLHRAIEMHF